MVSYKDFSPVAHSTPWSSDTSSLTDTISLSSSDSDLREAGISTGHSTSSKDDMGSSAVKIPVSEAAKEVIERRKCLTYFWGDAIYKLSPIKTCSFQLACYESKCYRFAPCQMFIFHLLFDIPLSPLLRNMIWYVFLLMSLQNRIEQQNLFLPFNMRRWLKTPCIESLAERIFLKNTGQKIHSATTLGDSLSTYWQVIWPRDMGKS